ncbi:MAG: DUF922 domain-containing protein [Chitinophagaceae bacterium]|nr:DUF922 domain-containing protein [Chitinophagaceae bacterium]MCW5904124.1 DUF922 domain-containing protein [Chitinophagaceae bacterium]
MKIVPLITLLLLSNPNVFSQKIIVNGEESTGKISWSDFTGKVDKNSSYFAFTSYKFKTKVGTIKFIGDSVVISSFDVILELDNKNSWAKKDKITDELLVHEQGHFNIGILCVKEIMANYKKAKFTKSNYSTLLQSIVSDASKKYKEMGLKYDRETNHSKNKEEQEKWNTYFKENLSNN